MSILIKPSPSASGAARFSAISSRAGVTATATDHNMETASVRFKRLVTTSKHFVGTAVDHRGKPELLTVEVQEARERLLHAIPGSRRGGVRSDRWPYAHGCHRAILKGAGLISTSGWRSARSVAIKKTSRRISERQIIDR